MATFAEHFARTNGCPIEVDGRCVRMLFNREAVPGLLVRLRWLRCVKFPVQGISFGVKGGTLRVNGTRARDVVLWSDTAPDQVTLECEGRNLRELSIWHCWHDERDVTCAWVGNAGMIVEEIGPSTYRVLCNSRPEVTFDDLVFELEFEDPSCVSKDVASIDS